jgi:hypothetical protein
MTSRAPNSLRLRPGEWVEVRSQAEILSTLDRDASHDGLPFMPEMLRYCGSRFQVYKRADKTCDTVTNTGARRLYDTVHLKGLRCDGSAHGGCEAGCLMFWRERWLKRVNGASPDNGAASSDAVEARTGVTVADLERATVIDASRDLYSCQIIQLKRFTKPLPWWDVRQYWRDYATKSVDLKTMISSFWFAAYRTLTEIGIAYRLLVRCYDWVQSLRGAPPFPLRTGTCEKTPTQLLDLKPGELVRVKSYAEILATLDKNNKNRGLWFDAEMVQYCGKTYRVAKRVRRILDEKTGPMLVFSNPGIVLEDVVCRATKTKLRLFCPRSILTYWREIWLERV